MSPGFSHVLRCFLDYRWEGVRIFHFREVCKEQLGWGVEEEEPGCSPARSSSAAVVTDDASPNVLWSCVTREAVLSPSVLELAFNLVWNERLVKMMNGAGVGARVWMGQQQICPNARPTSLLQGQSDRFLKPKG